MGHRESWAHSWASHSLRENGGNHTDWASSSSSASARDHTEDDHMIAQVLSEELSGGDGAVGKRLAHLSSTPHVPRINRSIPTVDDASFDHQRLSERLREYGLGERRMTGDGNCQFRAISDQLYRTPEKHKSVRKQVVYQLKAFKEIYEGYVPMKYSDYLRRMGRSGEWGDHVTLQAAADSFGMKIWLVTSFRDTSFIEITPKFPKKLEDIFLSFWSEVHYNSLYPTPEAPSYSQPKMKKKHWLF